MFRQIYEIAAMVFLLQGVLIPVLLLVAGTAWFGQMSRLSALEKTLVEDRKRHRKTLDSLLGLVPKLQPLNCASCGSPVALEAASAKCISCRSVADLPEDYSAALALRRTLARLSTSAVRHWWVARILVASPVRWFFFLMIFGEPLLFMLVLIGAATWSDTWADRVLEWIGEGWAFAVGLMAFGGFILWMIVFIFLSNLSKELRRELTDFPVFRRREVRDPEYSTCETCGGGIRFARRSFASLCGYCAVPNFRAAQARHERAESEGQQLSTRWSLFGAMEIIEGFTGTFFVTMTILALGFALLVLFTALGAD